MSSSVQNNLAPQDKILEAAGSFHKRTSSTSSSSSTNNNSNKNMIAEHGDGHTKKPAQEPQLIAPIPQSKQIPIEQAHRKPQPVNIEPKPTPKLAMKPLAPLAPKKQLLPKLLPAQAKPGTKINVNTSKQWVLPPRPRPGRKSTDNTPAPSSNVASPAASHDGATPPSMTHHGSPPASSVVINKKQTKVRKTAKSKKSAGQASSSPSTIAMGEESIEAGHTRSAASPAAATSASTSAAAADTATTKTTTKTTTNELDAKGNFELKLQLQNATEENENLRKIINKLNREIDLLKLVKLENKAAGNRNIQSVNLAAAATVASTSTASTERILKDLSTTIDPVKINYKLKSKRLKKVSSEAGYHSGIGLNGNSLDDAGFYNADSLIPADLFLSNHVPQRQEQELNEKVAALAPHSRKKPHTAVKLEKSRSVPSKKSSILSNLDTSAFKKNYEPCGFCSQGSPCVCYESTMDVTDTMMREPHMFGRNLQSPNNNSNIKMEEDDDVPLPPLQPVPVPQQQQQQTKLSRTTDIIGNLGKNFIKNEMDVDMSFFIKPEERDLDDFMMM